MKITFVSLPGLPYHVAGVPGPHGGAEAQTTVLAQGLRARGHEVVVVVTDFDEAARRSPRITDLRLVNAFNGREGIFCLRFVHPRWSGLHRALAETDPDVVFHMAAGVATGQVAYFCRRAGRAFVYATASDSDVDPAKLRLGFRARRFYEYGLRRADRVVTQHGRQAAELERNYGIASLPVPLGMPLPDSIPEPDHPPRVVWLGTIRRVKRPERWLEMAARFPGVRFVMAGGRAASDPALYDAIAGRASGIENVEFLGSVPDIDPVLSGAAVLLNTSEVEGFPTTFLEAWGRGIPVVSYFDPDGLVERLGLGRVALDESAMEEALRNYLEHRHERDAAGARGRSYVMQTHAPDAVAARMEEIFLDAVEARKGSAGHRIPRQT